MSSIILILGDQLDKNSTILVNCDKEKDIILMCEVIQECTTPRHHKKKIVFSLSSMRHFAQELKNNNYNIEYVFLDDKENTHSFKSEIKRACKKYHINNIKVAYPGEYRVLQYLKELQKEGIKIDISEDTKFLCSRQEFAQFASDKKKLVMENFYRYMRKKHNILMSGDKPIGDKWNFDSENREVAKKGLNIAPYYKKEPDEITKQVISLVEQKFSNHFGDIMPFQIAVTREDAISAVKHFIKYRLKNFGTYQDAMIEDEDFMFHSHISFYLNNGLINPREVISLVQREFMQEKIPLNSAEGFIRQVLGWREYIRGIYWLKMPQYKKLNFFNAKSKLPHFYWDGDTKMNCIYQCIKNTKINSYAHHIQRLMVLGNFALIASIDPKEVNQWFAIVYLDAYEWVELPNVSGMILFADGGLLATKPYAASGAYINKMSNYCTNCKYNVKKKEGPDACPFNYLYWNFLIKNKALLESNHRMGMIYRILAKFSDQKITQIKHDSKNFFDKINDKNT